MSDDTAKDWLTKAERHDLSGYWRPSFQKRWFIENGIRFHVRADGELVVFRADLGRRSSPHDDGELDFEPDQRKASGG